MRSHGRLRWDPAIGELPEHLGAVLRSQSGLAVKVQLLSAEGRPAWPLEHRQLEQRYEDAPRAELTVPTRPAFVAGKTATWCDRRTPRDLWNLSVLSRIGAFETEVADMYRRFGPTKKLPGQWQFANVPAESDRTLERVGAVCPGFIADRPRVHFCVISDQFGEAVVGMGDCETYTGGVELARILGHWTRRIVCRSSPDRGRTAEVRSRHR